MLPGNIAAQLPILSAVLPFLLLIMVTLRLPLTNPSPVFGLALLLVVLMLGVTKLFSLDWMPAVGLVAWPRWKPPGISTALTLPTRSSRSSGTWSSWRSSRSIPFLFLRKFSDRVVPWAAAAMAGPLQFFLCIVSSRRRIPTT